MGTDSKEVNMTDGRWRVVTWDWGYRTASFIEHNCESRSFRDALRHNSKWRDHAQLCAYRGAFCEGCGDAPPEGLQAMYVLLSDDMCELP
jgi:hypothetical protein